MNDGYFQQDVYYHWYPEKLQCNQIIKAGKYGELVESIDKIYQKDKYYLEEQFEVFRQKYHSDKPSRFKSIFLLKTIEDALLYRKQLEIKEAYDRILYRVKILDRSKSIHVGSTSLFNQYCLRGQYEKAAFHYFNGDSSSLTLPDTLSEPFPQEVITESDVVIVGIVVNS